RRIKRRGWFNKKLAIARLAASDNAPKTTPIPHQTKPSKPMVFIQGKDAIKNKASNIYLTSQNGSQPRKSVPENQYDLNKVQQDSWVTVARDGHKKSRTIQPLLNSITKSTSPHHRLPVRPPNNIRNSKNAKKSNLEKTDSRLFVRLSPEHEWRKFSPAGTRKMIVKRLSVSPASIGLIKPVRIGFPLSPCSIEAREDLLKASGG
ncbi:hypothetical protein EPUL_003538, partial [Erysiphe pulchra]